MSYRSNKYAVWIVVLINLSMSPEERTKKENMRPVLLVSMQEKPTDMILLCPIIEELKRGLCGVPLIGPDANIFT